MNFKGKAKRIEDIDLPLIGRLIGVGEDEVHAILDVESAGSGFDRQGRPKMLFEPHIFWKELGPGPKRDKAAAQGLAYSRWKPGAYPGDSYPRMAKALAIDENAALRSASWGLGQIMGFNCKLAGYPTAKDMVTAFLDDEDTHLAAMIRFIKATGLDDELRRHDWAGFARGYNGAGFAKNGYDRKLRDAFAKWQRIKDTPVPNVKSAPVSDIARPVVSKAAPAVPDGIKQLGFSDVKSFQGAYGLDADGIVGPKTRAAMNKALAAMKAPKAATVQKGTDQDPIKKPSYGAGVAVGALAAAGGWAAAKWSEVTQAWADFWVYVFSFIN